MKENSNRKTGIVYVRSRGFDESGDAVIDYVRWVMVRKRNEAAPAPPEKVPELPKSVSPAQLGSACPSIDTAAYDNILAGSVRRFGDYKVGEKIDHVDGVTVEEAEHQIATRLYQNTARVHFNQFAESSGRFGRRLRPERSGSCKSTTTTSVSRARTCPSPSAAEPAVTTSTPSPAKT